MSDAVHTASVFGLSAFEILSSLDMVLSSASPRLQRLINELNTAATSAEVILAVSEISALRLVEAIPILIEVLGYNNPAAAGVALRGLTAIGEPAVVPLMELLDGFNYGARAWALQALAVIGEPRSIDLLVKAALEDFALSVRRAAARGVGKLNWQALSGECDRITAQAKALDTLIQVCDDPEWVVRYAAVTGLEALGQSLELVLKEEQPRLQQRLEKIVEQDESLALQARARLALRRLADTAV